MYNLIRYLIFVSAFLIVPLMTGCFVTVPYEESKISVPAGTQLRLEIQVAADEVIEGSWTADGAINGTYTRPSGTRFSWLASSGKHTFTIEGKADPGLYIFNFDNSGNEASEVHFRYRTKKLEQPG